MRPPGSGKRGIQSTVPRIWLPADELELIALRARGETKAECARLLGRSYTSVENRISELVKQGRVPRSQAPYRAKVAAPVPLDNVIAKQAGRELHVTNAGRDAVLTQTTHEPIRTLADLITVCEIDVNVWDVKDWEARAWDTSAKDADSQLVTRTQFRIRAVLVARSAEVDDVRKGILDAIRARVKPLRPRLNATHESGYLFVATMGEPHLGKLAWAPETGEHYDLQIGLERVRSSHRHLMQRALALKPERIALIVGDDFFTADNPQGTTTAGTPQDMDGRYRKIFRAGVGLCREVIEGWREIAPVSVWVKPGNHDTFTVWQAGEVLAAIYAATADVEVVNPDRLRTYQQWGCCLIGLTHGDKEKDEKLPMLMAHEAKHEWAATTCRVWLTGHLHTLKAKTQRAVIQPMRSDVHEEAGVVIRRCRSLSGTDNWHASLGYVGNIKAAEGFVFSKTLGETDIHTGVVAA